MINSTIIWVSIKLVRFCTMYGLRNKLLIIMSWLKIVYSYRCDIISCLIKHILIAVVLTTAQRTTDLNLNRNVSKYLLNKWQKQLNNWWIIKQKQYLILKHQPRFNEVMTIISKYQLTKYKQNGNIFKV